MQLLLIDDKTKAEIKRVKEYAESHERTVENVFVEPSGAITHSADLDKNYSLVIPVGYTVNYTIDMMFTDKVRHLSVSVNRPNRLPSITHCVLIAREFGFKAKDILDFYNVWIENNFAANMIEEYE